mgnify:CR=1 FL=1
MQEGQKVGSDSQLDGVNSDQFRYLNKNRLKTAEQFRNVFNTGKRSIDSQFIILAKENFLGYSRLGMAIPKKKINRAIDRNSIKRLIRECFRKSTIAEKGYDIVVLPQKKVDVKQKELLKNSLNSHWEKIHK